MSTHHRLMFIAAIVCAITVPRAFGQFSETAVEPFGMFGGTEYVRYSGRFEGTTDLGDFDVPFELVAPADPAAGNGTVLVEPSHFTLGPGVRDLVLTPRFLYSPRSHPTWASRAREPRNWPGCWP